ncbi:glycoside hydrolase family 16 protein [Pedobacter frigidisoli]|uniref:Glycoside hydrolase family 16 protein n=1 Tax=Pedobacter frigidisoli TaxID=2530455 RepID=A0A4R0NJP1_9SPHI|nr:glycoside hydrolase family 16 protein [Pedobacter frigidisoli]TCD00756.1 glycoside hydrolase family 16 protein [Pedobacter frigidisoli]
MKNIISLLLFLCSFELTFAQNDGSSGKLIWADEFNYSGPPDSTKWDYENGIVRNKEPQYYTKKRQENARVENGNLVIEAKKEDYRGAEYTSASLITLGKMHLRYGRIEVRAKVPKGIGSWPAIWMLGVNRELVKWPSCGEIDILEYIGRDSTSAYGTVHFKNGVGKYEMSGQHPFVGKPYDDFHNYTFEWDKKKMTMSYDNIKYFEFNIADADKNAQKIFSSKFYLLLNLALGRVGTLGGRLDPDILPITFLVDYVRIYK